MVFPEGWASLARDPVSASAIGRFLCFFRIGLLAFERAFVGVFQVWTEPMEADGRLPSVAWRGRADRGSVGALDRAGRFRRSRGDDVSGRLRARQNP